MPFCAAGCCALWVRSSSTCTETDPRQNSGLLCHRRSDLGGSGLYQYLVDWAGAGATVPLTGFGYTLAKGAREAVQQHGLLGAFIGGAAATAGGVAAAIFFGFLAALLFKARPKH